MNHSHIYVIGNVNIDLIMGPQTPWPAVGTEAVVPHSELRAGGAAGNVALALQALQAPFTLIANRGQDPFGNWLADAFAHTPTQWMLSDAPTSISVGITHPDGERTFFSHLGHLEHLKLDDVRITLTQLALEPTILEPTTNTRTPQKLVIVMGAFLTPQLRHEYTQLFELFQTHDLQLVLDPGWPPEGWTDTVRTEVKSWLRTCQHLLVNEIEALGITGCDTIQAAAQALQAQMPTNATVVIKCGADGATAWQANHTTQAPAPKVNVIDTIGAGDTFNAGYLTGIVNGLNLSECVQKGVETASFAVSTNPRRYSAL